MLFTNLRALLIQEANKEKEETTLFIKKGYCFSWSEEHRKESDNGLRRHSTATRWEQYQNGNISREKAEELAIKRAMKQHDKQLNEALKLLQSVENAEELNYINISIDWVSSRTWGNNPHVEAFIDGKMFTGSASGCGYDKESAAVAQALNKSYRVLKVLYTLKENGLQEGKNTNGDILGYGSGYGVFPAFEGGVGVNCFWQILEKVGYKVESHHGKRSDFYNITKES
ncbi:hypothetical protein [Criibacterium bergeronii]|uniref:Uncharacterized protein n=1 Tax=Criibacterium bergeronii TaxID=1871336 RepID=A0A1C0AG45_9FIRM|nr:hypothetical protein [Criibacterium bergeronii]RDY21428.1 hypothetical protein BBG48_004730 [Criibacterium bergeronii]